jgi:hypothetical protein
MELGILRTSLFLLVLLQTARMSQSQSLFKVSGRLVGNTMSGVVLRGPGGEVRGTVQPDGTFEFTGVRPGNYAASPVPSNPFGRPESVRVQAADIRDVTVQNPVIRQVSGRVVTPANSGIPSLVLSIPPTPLPNLAAPDPRSPVSPDLLAAIQMILNAELEVPLKIDSAGKFVVDLPEAERRISILKRSIPAGYTLEAFTYGSNNLLSNPLRIEPGPLSEISIVLRNQR